MPTRARIEIIAQILEIAKDGGVNKTKIMYSAALSYCQMKEYVAMLEYKCLLSHNQTQRLYKTTDKGFAFLQIYAQLNSILESSKIDLETASRATV